MYHLSADPHDAADASDIGASGAVDAPVSTVTVLPVNETVGMATTDHDGLQESAGEDGSSTRYDVCEVQVRTPAFVSFSAAHAVPSQLSGPTHGVSMALQSTPAFLEVEKVHVSTPPHIFATMPAKRGGSAAAPEDDSTSVALHLSSTETRADAAAAAEDVDNQQQQQQGHFQPGIGTATGPCNLPATAAAPDSQAWVVDFAPLRPMPMRKMTKKERDTIKQLRRRSRTVGADATAATMTALSTGGGLGADSEGNVVVTRGAGIPAASPSLSALQVVSLDTLAVAREALIPTNLKTTRADLEARLVLRLPRLLCVCKQYPRGCGIASLTSVYNYLYSWLGESDVGAHRAPHSQEEIISILGFEPPFGDIAWGPFTGNVTLIRWFHALNRHFGLRGRAYVLYKAHGSGRTTHLYADNTEALAAVKAALRDPHCALIYHCYNHYMVPVGYQDIPLAQTDFLKPTVPESSCETTLFIGEVSRGRHEALYARKWSQIVKDIECKSPFFFNIRRPEQGVQRLESKKKSAEEGADEGTGGAVPRATTAAAAKAQMGEAERLRQMQQEQEDQEQQDGHSSDAYSAAETILVALPNTPPLRATAAPGDVNNDGADVGVLDNAARSTSRDTLEAMELEAAATPSLPSLPMQQHLAHSSSSEASTKLIPGPEFAEVPEDAAGHLSITTVLQPGIVAAEHLATAQSPVNCETDFGASPEAQSAQLLPGEALGARLADNAVTSMREAVHSVPASSITPAPFSSPLPQQLQLGAAHAGTETAAEAPRSSKRAPLPPKSKRERGNLHCIICFRNDEVEPHLERYEETSVPLPGTAAVPSWRSLSSVSRGGNSHCNAEDV
ncbi:hypothetical protein CUR178_07484 [Leishmania enriettii]|uniref:Basic immunoglobulin-like variable motif-containing protein n=1 Tax=Leishmania enriettii TaxID=5663 RepID=A0A836HZU4_LEIEN|nr:hypothetical protein CUR178_07484 [Leishmania enriettii]